MFPYMNGMMPVGNMPISKDVTDEIRKLKEEIDLLKERVKHLENAKKNTFLQKDDGFYMM